MRGLGTIVNVIAMVIGGLLGLLCRGGLKDRFRDTLVQACGLATIFIGASGALQMIFRVGDDGLETSYTMLIVLSLVIGGLVGEAINIEKRLDSIGEKLKNLVKAKSDSRFVDGFVTVSLVTCVGAMAICGPLEEGLTGNSQTLFVKSILDTVITAVFASAYGVGAIFGAATVGIYQGLITVFAVFISPFMSEHLIMTLSGIGSVLIFGVGLNLLAPKKCKVGNLLPALLIPVVYEGILLLPWFS